MAKTRIRRGEKDLASDPRFVSLDRKRAAEAELAEMKARKERGLLIEREVVLGDWQAHVHAARQCLLNLPHQMGSEGLIRREDEPRVVELIHEALSELSRWAPPEVAS